jgi:hypothetical protein
MYPREDTPVLTPANETPTGEWTPVPARPGVDLDIRHKRTYVAKEKVARFGKETHPSRNSRVCWVDPNTTENPLDYEVLAFVDNDEYYLNENTVPVILHQGDWFELRYSEHSKTPYLGVQRDDIHAYDIPTSDEESTTSSSDDDSSNEAEASSEDQETNPRGEGSSKRKHKKKKDKGKGKAKEKTPSSDDQEIRSTPISPEDCR